MGTRAPHPRSSFAGLDPAIYAFPCCAFRKVWARGSARKKVIWGSIFGVLPFTLVLPHVGLAATVAWYADNEWWWRPLKAGVA